MKLFLQSLGCNKNLVDSEIMLGRLKEYEITNEASEADVLIVNTCGFIKSAKIESINAILELHEIRKKGSILVVTGCLMQRYKDELVKELPEVDLFAGVSEYAKIDELIASRESRFRDFVYLQDANTQRVITGSNTHAYIKIAEGCNQTCSFCAIPTFKGKLKSRPIDDVVAEVKGLVARGFYDFSFIAQDTSSYLKDLKISDGLENLISEIEKIEGIKAARILYLYPSSIKPSLITKIINSKVFVNYFDMPLQHSSDKLLKIMKRGYDKAKAISFLEQMRAAPNSFLRTGFIVGHPGESEEDFEDLCEFIKEFDFDRISVFAYSKEEDTAAYSMQQINANTIKRRLKKIEKIVDAKINASFEKMLNQEIIASCLGESSEGEFFIGAKPLLFDRDIDGEILINESEIGELKVGDLIVCKITQVHEKTLIATAIRRYEN
ncbi:30S ribosomal protein S12 methylthiotransferase RimO [Campylobacter sp. RM9334]|uniref:30S ribosomal protein S12 methylthiotransferase RimO n=1 Tax=Campylobacter sp. RM9334 TaxID=2735732 RepID=UPI001DD7E4D6|nr:30S ribosomal protein S12 methylthiotransferase RimO [Campylobacter sp. RM9334]